MKPVFQLMLALTAGLFLCRPVLAQAQAPRVEKYPEVKPGARFSYVNGVFLLKCNQWEVKGASLEGQIVSKCGTNTMYVTADSGNPIRAVNDKGETVAKFMPYYPGLSFPLYVGKKWSGKYNAQQGSQEWFGELSCESTAFEKIQVAAGKFEAFRIECVNKWDSGIIFINGKKKATTWYAPSINMIIKSINDDSQWNYELANAG